MPNCALIFIGYLPTVAASERFTDSIGTALATMRGVAMLGFTANDDAVDHAWSIVRRELLRAGLPVASDMIPPR